jgi:hypothetical protein
VRFAAEQRNEIDRNEVNSQSRCGALPVPYKHVGARNGGMGCSAARTFNEPKKTARHQKNQRNLRYLREPSLHPRIMHTSTDKIIS